MELRKNLIDIYKVVGNDEELLRLLYYPTDPLSPSKLYNCSNRALVYSAVFFNAESRDYKIWLMDCESQWSRVSRR